MGYYVLTNRTAGSRPVYQYDNRNQQCASQAGPVFLYFESQYQEWVMSFHIDQPPFIFGMKSSAQMVSAQMTDWHFKQHSALSHLHICRVCTDSGQNVPDIDYSLPCAVQLTRQPTPAPIATLLATQAPSPAAPTPVHTMLPSMVPTNFPSPAPTPPPSPAILKEVYVYLTLRNQVKSAVAKAVGFVPRAMFRALGIESGSHEYCHIDAWDRTWNGDTHLYTHVSLTKRELEVFCNGQECTHDEQLRGMFSSFAFTRELAAQLQQIGLHISAKEITLTRIDVKAGVRVHVQITRHHAKAALSGLQSLFRTAEEVEKAGRKDAITAEKAGVKAWSRNQMAWTWLLGLNQPKIATILALWPTLVCVVIFCVCGCQFCSYCRKRLLRPTEPAYSEQEIFALVNEEQATPLPGGHGGGGKHAYQSDLL
jgi:hypothetical protein